MMTSRTPRFERLLDWIEGRLSKEEAEIVAAQIAQADERTLADAAWARAFVRLGDEITLEAPPDYVREELMARFASYAESKAAEPDSLSDRLADVFQRVVASLTFDSNLQPALSGVRTAGSHRSRHLIYTSEVADVVLTVRPHDRGDRFYLCGQVFPYAEPDSLDLSVQLLHDADEAAITTTDWIGEFIFDSVEAGEYSLALSGPDREIVIRELDVRSS